jgi:glycosyltransferase involved in cell wall biosynthesis
MLETHAMRDAGQNGKVAYLMSRFPTLTETFVLYEILAVEEQGLPVEVYPLLRRRQPVVHPEAEAMVRRAHFHPFLSRAILRANWHYLRRRPRAYLGVLGEVLRGTWGSANFFVGALGIFPKAVRFAYEMTSQHVTHVHAHYSNHPTVAALVIHRLTGIPFSFTGHGHDLHVERRMLGHKLQAASFAVMISEYNRRLVLDECGPAIADKLHLIHCGVDTRLFTPGSRTIADGPLSIVCVASLIEVKGHRYLVEACRLLRERGISFVCHLIGEGRERSRLTAQIADAGLQDKVLLEGARPRADVVRMVREADVIVLTSAPTRRGAREGVPVALMEGMACGLPVVASGISGIPELVDDGRTGFLTPPREPRAVADALERLARDPELRRRLGAAGREKVQREFDLHTNAARLIQMFLAHGGTAKPALCEGMVCGSEVGDRV